MCWGAFTSLHRYFLENGADTSDAASQETLNGVSVPRWVTWLPCWVTLAWGKRKSHCLSTTGCFHDYVDVLSPGQVLSDMKPHEPEGYQDWGCVLHPTASCSPLSAPWHFRQWLAGHCPHTRNSDLLFPLISSPVVRLMMVLSSAHFLMILELCEDIGNVGLEPWSEHTALSDACVGS